MAKHNFKIGNKHAQLHGFARHPLFAVWRTMINRCHNPDNHKYSGYGARGISVCNEWRYDFIKFATDMGERPGKGYSIGRINNDGNYEPENCRWETPQQQTLNRRSNIYYTFNGDNKTLKELVDMTDFKYKTVWNRLKKGYSIEDALTLKINQKRK